MIHKSSPFTFLFKYLIPLSAIISFLFIFFQTNNKEVIEWFYIQPLILFGLAAVSTSIFLIKLKFAEATK